MNVEKRMFYSIEVNRLELDILLGILASIKDHPDLKVIEEFIKQMEKV